MHAFGVIRSAHQHKWPLSTLEDAVTVSSVIPFSERRINSGLRAFRRSVFCGGGMSPSNGAHKRRRRLTSGRRPSASDFVSAGVRRQRCSCRLSCYSLTLAIFIDNAQELGYTESTSRHPQGCHVTAGTGPIAGSSGMIGQQIRVQSLG